MATQQNQIPHQAVDTPDAERLNSEPLQLNEMLELIRLADESGYSVKSAHNMKHGYNSILAEVYSVWFAIENEITIFAHNIPWLIEFMGQDYSEESANENKIDPVLTAS